jgi:hypothetical protein
MSMSMSMSTLFCRKTVSLGTTISCHIVVTKIPLYSLRRNVWDMVFCVRKHLRGTINYLRMTTWGFAWLCYGWETSRATGLLFCFLCSPFLQSAVHVLPTFTFRSTFTDTIAINQPTNSRETSNTRTWESNSCSPTQQFPNTS